MKQSLKLEKGILRSIEQNKTKNVNPPQTVMKIKPIREIIGVSPRSIQSNIFAGISDQLAYHGEVIRAKEMGLRKRKELETEIELVEDEMKKVIKKEAEKRNKKYAELEAAAKKKELETMKKLQEEIKKRERIEKKKGHKKVNPKEIKGLEQEIMNRLEIETKKIQEGKEKLLEESKKRESDLRDEFEQKIKKLEEEKKKEIETEMKKIEIERKKEIDDLKTISIGEIKQREGFELRLEDRIGKQIDGIQEKLRRTETLEEELAAIEEKLVKTSKNYDKMKSDLISEINNRIATAVTEKSGAEGVSSDVLEVIDELKNSNESLQSKMDDVQKKIDEVATKELDISGLKDQFKATILEESLTDKKMDEMIKNALTQKLNEQTDFANLLSSVESIKNEISGAKDKFRTMILEESLIDEKIDEVVKRTLTQKIREEIDFTNLTDTISKLQKRGDTLESDILDIQGRLMSIIQKGGDEGRITELEDKLTTLIKAMEPERLRSQEKLTSIESKLVAILKREEEEKIKLDKLTQIEKLEGASLTNSIEELSKIYEISQRKVEASKEELTTIKEKLAIVLKKQREEEENRLKSLAKAHEVTKRRLVALEELAKLEEPTPEEVKLIGILRKRKEELEDELDKEKDIAAILKKEIPISLPTASTPTPTVGFDDLKSTLLKTSTAPTAPPSAEVPPPPAAKPVTLTCPKCKGKIEVASPERPIKIKCTMCGAEGTLKK